MHPLHFHSPSWFATVGGGGVFEWKRQLKEIELHGPKKKKRKNKLTRLQDSDNVVGLEDGGKGLLLQMSGTIHIPYVANSMWKSLSPHNIIKLRGVSPGMCVSGALSYGGVGAGMCMRTRIPGIITQSTGKWLSWSPPPPPSQKYYRTYENYTRIHCICITLIGFQGTHLNEDDHSNAV